MGEHDQAGLLRALRAKDAKVRAEAAMTLGKPRASERVVQALENMGRRGRRRWARRYSLSDQQIALAALFKTGQTSRALATSAQAISTLYPGEPATDTALFNSVAEATHKFSAIPSHDTIHFCSMVMKHCHSYDIVWRCIEVLESIPSKEVVNMLRSFLTEEVSEVRRESHVFQGVDPIDDYWTEEVHSFPQAPAGIRDALRYEIALTTSSWSNEWPSSSEAIEEARARKSPAFFRLAGTIAAMELRAT